MDTDRYRVIEWDYNRQPDLARFLNHITGDSSLDDFQLDQILDHPQLSKSKLLVFERVQAAQDAPRTTVAATLEPEPKSEPKPKSEAEQVAQEQAQQVQQAQPSQGTFRLRRRKRL